MSEQVDEWMDVARLAEVEVSSEDELFPVDRAIAHAVSNGWRAAAPGPQVIRLLFREPQRIRAVRLHAVDRVAERRQRMVLLAGESAERMQEVLRREFVFVPGGSTEETEEAELEIDGARVVELRIDPNVAHPNMAHAGGHEEVYASLRSFWLR